MDHQPQSSESRKQKNPINPESHQAGLMEGRGRNPSASDGRRKHRPPQEPEQDGNPPSNYFSMNSFLVLVLVTLSLLILPLALPPLPPPPSVLLLLPIGILVVLMILAFMPSDIRNIASTSV